jgi:hypothetical protein
MPSNTPRRPAVAMAGEKLGREIAEADIADGRVMARRAEEGAEKARRAAEGRMMGRRGNRELIRERQGGGGGEGEVVGG